VFRYKARSRHALFETLNVWGWKYSIVSSTYDRNESFKKLLTHPNCAFLEGVAHELADIGRKNCLQGSWSFGQFEIRHRSWELGRPDVSPTRICRQVSITDGFIMTLDPHKNILCTSKLADKQVASCKDGHGNHRGSYVRSRERVNSIFRLAR
jgi:hypothetical protein